MQDNTRQDNNTHIATQEHNKAIQDTPTQSKSKNENNQHKNNNKNMNKTTQDKTIQYKYTTIPEQDNTMQEKTRQ